MTGLGAWWLTRSKLTRAVVVAVLLFVAFMYVPVWLLLVVPGLVFVAFLGGLVHGAVDLVKHKRAARAGVAS